MANFGVQLSSELSKIQPIKDLVGYAYETLLAYARDLRKSGSDIVVEEDLATIFGRMTVVDKLDSQFKDVVKDSKFTIIKGIDQVRLDANAGPTVLNALAHRTKMALVVQLSMLASFHDKHQLATMISDAITKRYEHNVNGAAADPGSDGIASTINAISSQCNSFTWCQYSQEVEKALRRSIPGYQYHLGHSKLSPAIIIGAMDFLHIVQSLPNDRRVSLSTEEGCIPMVIWAHYILGLNVGIYPPSGQIVSFGPPKDVQILIYWVGSRSVEHEMLLGPVDNVPLATISLHERDMEVLIVHEPDPENRTPIRSDDRHTIQGYGSVYLRRVLNVNSIILDDDPIYGSAAALAISLAIHVSQKLCFSLGGSGRSSKPHYVNPEFWRIIKVGSLLFDSLDLSKADVQNFKGYVDKYGMNENQLPNSFSSFLKTVKAGDHPIPPERRLLDHIRYLVKLLLRLSFIANIEKCSSMQILFNRSMGGDPYNWTTDEAFAPSPGMPLIFREDETFSGILDLLAVRRIAQGDVWNMVTQEAYPFLCSEFGWSVWYDIVGDKDPSEVSRELVHVERGVPTNIRTGERRYVIQDGEHVINIGPEQELPGLYYQGAKYLPRALGSLHSKKAFWLVKPTCFEHYNHYSILPSAAWSDHAETHDRIDFSLGYGYSFHRLSEVETTPACKHAPLPPKSTKLDVTQLIKLGPDAVTVEGFVPKRNGTNVKITIHLTRGVPALRWYAVVNLRPSCMLVTHDCCETCALEYTASRAGYWDLIL